VKFIEDNWLGGQPIGSGPGDTTTGTLDPHVRLPSEPVAAAAPEPRDRGAARRSL